ncbi:MAG: hypothetical protein GY751_11965 [Bacteroidetes bacterium]|nr:hypothetical protein [Bacteroidota bacterium]
MKPLLITSFLCFSLLMSTFVSAQDFFGAQNTGRHTVGVNFKYDGDFWLGAHYNLRRFPVLTLKSNFDFNMIGEFKIKDGFGGVGAEMGFGHVLADGKDLKAGFGLGMRYGLRYEYIQEKYDDDDVDAFINGCSKLTTKFEVKPGGYGLQYSVAPTIRTDMTTFYFRPSNPEYSEEENKFEFKYFDNIVVGVHMDYTTAKFLGSGTQYHVTADVEETIYFGVKEKRAWKTWSLKGDYPQVNEDDGRCGMPENNLQLRMSHSIRF